MTAPPETGHVHTPSPAELADPVVSRARAGMYVDYRQYLRSGWWRRTVRRATYLAGWRCQVHEGGQRCTNRSRLQVHHRHYETLGSEDPAKDLVVVCPKHHRMIHGIPKGKR